MLQWLTSLFSGPRRPPARPSPLTRRPAKDEPVDFLAGPRMFFALREKLQEDGLGYSQQARSLEMSFLRNREYMLEELSPLFRALDQAGIPRTYNPEYWWWYLDDDQVVERATRRLSHGY